MIEKKSLQKSSTARSGKGRKGECRDETAYSAQGSRVVGQDVRPQQGDKGEKLALPLGREGACRSQDAACALGWGGCLTSAKRGG